MAVTYATIADLRNVLSGTDSGTGTAAQLSDAQLTLALQAASARVSIFAGTVYDSSTPDLAPPDAFKPITLDLAAFYATTIYLKDRVIPQDSPIRQRYADAMQMLHDVRDGRLRLDPQAGTGVGAEPGTVINRIPRIFTGSDSNTVYDPATSALRSGTPSDLWSPGWGAMDGPWGTEYQG